MNFDKGEKQTMPKMMPVTRRGLLKISGLAVGSAIGSAVLAACGGSSAPPILPTSTAKPAQSAEPTQTPDPDETAVPTADPSKPAAPDAAGTVSLEIGTATGAKEFKYSKDNLEAAAGSKIKLKFTNNTDKKDEVGHNWVLVKPGQEDSVIANGKAAGDNKDWLDVNDLGIIAHTKLIEGEQKDTITFDAPPPGKYTYLSTFPDQYAGGMKGTLTIK